MIILPYAFGDYQCNPPPLSHHPARHQQPPIEDSPYTNNNTKATEAPPLPQSNKQAPTNRPFPIMAASGFTSIFSRLSSSLAPLDGKINSYLSLIWSDRNVASFTARTLKVLLGFWVVSRVNHALNMWARNHWCIRKLGQPWDFSGDKEIAVVTGGSSGFGLLIAKRLSQHCRVAVLDIQPPPKELQNCNVYLQCEAASPERVG